MRTSFTPGAPVAMKSNTLRIGPKRRTRGTLHRDLEVLVEHLFGMQREMEAGSGSACLRA